MFTHGRLEMQCFVSFPNSFVIWRNTMRHAGIEPSIFRLPCSNHCNYLVTKGFNTHLKYLKQHFVFGRRKKKLKVSDTFQFYSKTHRRLKMTWSNSHAISCSQMGRIKFKNMFKCLYSLLVAYFMKEFYQKDVYIATLIGVYT